MAYKSFAVMTSRVRAPNEMLSPGLTSTSSLASTSRPLCRVVFDDFVWRSMSVPLLV